MSNIKKNQRKESRFEVLALAHEIRRELELNIFVDFGLEKPRRDWTETEEWYIRARRDGLRQASDDLASNISSANCIKVVNETDFRQRRKYQNNAITSAYRIETQCMQLIERIPGININKYERLITELIREISLLRKWRNNDEARYKAKLQQG